MHDKHVVRRRRAVLVLLVVVSLILLTAYFGESPSSPLHSVQRGIVEVLSPIQEGASKALKPFRDVAGFFSDTFRAKSQRDQLVRENHRLQAELAQAQGALIQNQQLRRQVGLDDSTGISRFQPVAAHVISRDPTLWYATVEVDKGSDDGVRVDDPVTGDGALVGRVSEVGATYAIVNLLTDHDSAVAARVQDQHGDTGVLVPAVGNPNQLLLQYLDRHAPVQNGQQVVTAGFTTPGGSLQDLFPPNIPIGQVTGASQVGLLDNGQVQVSIAADLRHLDAVQILTRSHPGTQRASLP